MLYFESSILIMALPPAAAINPTLELRAGKLSLRPWQTTDAADLYQAVLASTEHLGRWLAWCRRDYTLADARAWLRFCAEEWRRGKQYAFAIRHDETAGVLGGVGLNRLDASRRSANLGYWVAQTVLRRGLATEASRLAARFAFAELGLARVEILVDLDNLASQGCATRIGACWEGVARNRLLVDQVPRDAAVYGLRPGDLAAVHPDPAHSSANAG